VETARADLTWRLSDVLFFDTRAEYTTTPLYNLTQLSAGMGLTY